MSFVCESMLRDEAGSGRHQRPESTSGTKHKTGNLTGCGSSCTADSTGLSHPPRSLIQAQRADQTLDLGLSNGRQILYDCYSNQAIF